MKTPPLKPLIIASLPVFASVFIAATLVWHFDTPKLVMPFVLGIIAGGLVDLDNRLTGRLKTSSSPLPCSPSPRCLPKAPSAQAFPSSWP